jgi:hypothetical protein
MSNRGSTVISIIQGHPMSSVQLLGLSRYQARALRPSALFQL